MSATAFLIALRMPRGPREVVTLVGRPHSPVVHLYVGALTPSGRAVPRRGRAVCSSRTRRLSVLEVPSGVVDPAGRRVCGNCVSALAGTARRSDRLVTRDDFLAAYTGVTMRDLVSATVLTRSTEESHKVGFLANLRFGPAPVREVPGMSDDARRLLFLHRRILAARTHLAAAERTPEQREAAMTKREAQAYNAELAMAARRKDAQIARAVDRRSRNAYMTPFERELLSSA